MQKTSLPFYVLLALIAAALIHLMHYYPQMSGKVAIHFNALGEADGWSEKSFFLWINIFLYCFMGLTFLGLGLLMKKIPVSMINLPNKEYRLSPERKETALSTVANYLYWFGCATMLLLLSIQHLVVRINLDGSGNIGPSIWVPLVGYLIFTVIWLVKLFLNFQKTK